MQDLDIDKLPKRMPYSLPPDAFEIIEQNVYQRIAEEEAQQQQSKRRRWRGLMFTGLGASIAAALLGFVYWVQPQPVPSPTIEEVDASFYNLTEAEQEGILDLYQTDDFINL